MKKKTSCIDETIEAVDQLMEEGKIELAELALRNLPREFSEAFINGRLGNAERKKRG
jgi:hypothetical protein